MKIRIDALDKPPPHALTISEVKAVLAIVPAEWKRFVSVVRLSAEMPDFSRFGRPVTLVSTRLTICSRGMSSETAYKEVLRELAVTGLGIHLRMVHRLSKADLQKVDQSITPFLEQLSAEANNSEAQQDAASNSV